MPKEVVCPGTSAGSSFLQIGESDGDDGDD
jgi:hypothetical protein